MKTAIRQRAQELGFEVCGFTTAAPPASAGHFHRWLAAGGHGEMRYLERNAARRTEPRLVLPGARTLIMLAAAYGEIRSGGDEASKAEKGSPGSGEEAGIHPERHPLTPSLSPGAGEGARFSGFVARYARFADYHKVLGERLEQLAGFVEASGGGETRSLGYVDTGPFLERDLAQRAGVGFIGKHTNLIHRRQGNWFFLAEIITTAELEPDAPERNRCGTCNRCLVACPTQAITAPFQLDARRCLSYLTIELKGSIPAALRPAVGNRIFGCDDCLAVCPWNRWAQAGRLMREHARRDLDAPDLLELLALDETGFQERFGDTPLARTRRRGLRRNVCVALGNAGDASVLGLLAQAAAESDSLVAEHAAWAMDRIRERHRAGARE